MTCIINNTSHGLPELRSLTYSIMAVRPVCVNDGLNFKAHDHLLLLHGYKQKFYFWVCFQLQNLKITN